MAGKELTSVSRVLEESVPGKQVTIAHVIASPVPEVYEHLGGGSHWHPDALPV